MDTLFALRLQDVRVIFADGSPRGSRFLQIWTLKQRESEQEESTIASIDFENSVAQTIHESAIASIFLLLNNIQTICFAHTRNGCELLIQKIHQELDRLGLGSIKRKVVSYRAGYSAMDRREIESRAKQGDISIIVCTNALELGIDIGSLGKILTFGDTKLMGI